MEEVEYVISSNETYSRFMRDYVLRLSILLLNKRLSIHSDMHEFGPSAKYVF
jgi:hypothetical protein